MLDFVCAVTFNDTNIRNQLDLVFFCPSIYFREHDFEKMDDEVRLNSFVSLTKNYYDKYKNTISVCFLLNEMNIEKYGGIPYIYHLNFIK